MEQNKQVLDCLQKIFQNEMAGVVRYLHYSFMVMGHHRIPIQKWLRDQANEAVAHSIQVGEKITSLGGHPTLLAAQVEETNVHTTDQILKESMKFEEDTLAHYKQLVQLAGPDIALEEFARGFVKAETEHLEEVRKMLRIEK